MVNEIRRISTVEQVVAHLQDQILSNSLSPGTWLREADLAEDLNVSRNTLRQGFQALSRAGLVEHLPHRGVRVTVLEPSDVEDILDARCVLEDTALATCKDSLDLSRRLKRIAGEIEGAAEAGNWTRLVDLDIRYHRALVDSLGSDRLTAFFEDLLRELRLAFIQIDRTEARQRKALPHVGEHRIIADSLAVNDIESARARLQRHLDDARRHLLSALEAGEQS